MSTDRKLLPASNHFHPTENVLEIIAILLLVVWLLGLLSGYMWDGAIHILPALAGFSLVLRWFLARQRR